MRPLRKGTLKDEIGIAMALLLPDTAMPEIRRSSVLIGDQLGATRFFFSGFDMREVDSLYTSHIIGITMSVISAV